MQALDRALSLAWSCHCHKAKAARDACGPVADDLAVGDRAIGGEEPPEIRIPDRMGQVRDVPGGENKRAGCLASSKQYRPQIGPVPKDRWEH